MSTCDLTCRIAKVLPLNASHDDFLPEVSSVNDSMSCTGQVYQPASIISDKALFQVSVGQGQSFSQFEYDPRREPAPRRQCCNQLYRGQTPPLPVDHRHVTGQDTMGYQEVSNQVRHLQCPSEYPAPDQGHVQYPSGHSKYD